MLNGVDPSWTALFEDLDGHFGNHEMEFVKNFVQNYSELQLVGAPRRKITLLPHPSTRSQSGVPRIQLFRRTARTRPPPVPSDGPVRPVIELEDDKSPPPTHAPPAKPLPSIPPDHRDLPFSREMELKQIRKETRYSHLRYSSVFRSARSPFFFCSASHFIGNTLLRSWFYPILLCAICPFPRLLIHPVLLHPRSAQARWFGGRSFLLQPLKRFRRNPWHPIQVKQRNFHPKAHRIT